MVFYTINHNFFAEVLLSASATHSNQYQTFLTRFQLDTPQSLGPFFVTKKHDTTESLRAEGHRLSHLFRTGIWVSEDAVCKWASTHPRQRISGLLEGRPIQKKVVRHEQRMAVPRQSFVTRCVSSVKFFGQYLRHPTTIGSLWPSSKYLAKQIVSEIQKGQTIPPRRILEVGPGTGAFTDKIIKRMNPGDILHLVEYEESLARELREKYKKIPNVVVFHRSILDHEDPEHKNYDHVVSGVPMNSFPPSMVKQFFTKFKELTREGGTLSYFDYKYLPVLKRASLVLHKQARAEFDNVLSQKDTFYSQYGFRKATVYRNLPLPPARVLHHRMPAIPVAS
jgi:phospholipid N-methyltransferase